MSLCLSRRDIRFSTAGGEVGKSESIARALLVMGMQKPLRVLCARELQVSIKESVHHLLADLIKELGLEAFYKVQNTEIKGANGTEFVFKGLKHNINEIKSFHAVDVCWVEEAVNVSKASWDVLIPTIRKEGSEIWVSFNPELNEDETYKRFVLTPPPNSWVQKVSWEDNNWFPSVLKDELEHLKLTDYDSYLNVWEGHPKQALEGAVYANEIRLATEENRIRAVPYDASRPVHTFWDLGWADQTSIWFVQVVNTEYRIIDFYENRHQPVSHYLQVIQGKGYLLGKDWLPHDARAKSLGTGKSIEEILRQAGRNVNITPGLSVEDGINAARTIFNRCYFDENKCADGLNHLRRYRYDKNTDGEIKRKPLHDEHSHAADAFRYLAVAIKDETKPRKRDNYVARGAGAWMG